MTPPGALILAAGLGQRLRPLTATRPKALVELDGKPLIGWILDDLVQSGITRIVVNLHHHAALLRNYLDLRTQPLIEYSDESDRLLDSGGGIAAVRANFHNAPFFVLNSDSLFPAFANGGPGVYGRLFTTLANIWNDSTMDAVLLLARRETSIGFPEPGDFELDHGRLRRPDDKTRAEWAYCGVQLLHPRLFDNTKETVFPLQPLWWRAHAAGRLFGVTLDGVWLHIGTPEALDAASAYLHQSPDYQQQSVRAKP